MNAMTALIQALQRLYFLPDQDDSWRDGLDEQGFDGLRGQLALLDSSAQVRTLVLSLAVTSAWPRLAAMLDVVLEDLGIAAPAVSISPVAGYQLWWSLAEPVPFDEAQRFLRGLVSTYLADIPEDQLSCLPGRDEESRFVMMVPALDEASGLWSAFIDPSLGAMFANDAPGLEFPPRIERQASMLATVNSIKLQDFRKALARLTAKIPLPAACPVLPEENPAIQGAGRPDSAAGFSAGSTYADPKSFLLAVMNDASVSTSDRIRAAAALLPYFSG